MKHHDTQLIAQALVEGVWAVRSLRREAAPYGRLEGRIHEPTLRSNEALILAALKATPVPCEACSRTGPTCPACLGAGEHPAPSHDNPYESATCRPCDGHGVVHREA